MTLIKICGITNWNDAKAAVDAGADALGFVCDENSPRLIEPDVFAEIAVRLPSNIKCVGVFDRATAPRWKIEGQGLIQQFHQIQYYQDSVWPEIIRENWDMDRKIKAFHLTRQSGLREIAGYNGLVRAFLLNIHTPAPKGYASSDVYGWEIARDVRQFGKQIHLAGGLTPENVAQAIARVNPYAVDVTVGVEDSPGVKDLKKMRDFVRAVRGKR